MHHITITDDNGSVYKFLFGENHSYRRQQGAVTLRVGIGPILPFAAEFDVNPDGTTQLRHVRAEQRSYHIHFAFEHKVEPTDGQRRTLARMLYHNDERIFPNFGSGPSAPLQHWAFQGLSTEDLEAIGNDGQRAFYV